MPSLGMRFMIKFQDHNKRKVIGSGMCNRFRAELGFSYFINAALDNGYAQGFIFNTPRMLTC